MLKKTVALPVLVLLPLLAVAGGSQAETPLPTDGMGFETGTWSVGADLMMLRGAEDAERDREYFYYPDSVYNVEMQHLDILFRMQAGHFLSRNWVAGVEGLMVVRADQGYEVVSGFESELDLSFSIWSRYYYFPFSALFAIYPEAAAGYEISSLRFSSAGRSGAHWNYYSDARLLHGPGYRVGGGIALFLSRTICADFTFRYHSADLANEGMHERESRIERRVRELEFMMGMKVFWK
ncbi:hypothetical protein GF324_13910 [bacterium]|nr:hypothetical protein [bacterium]